MSRLPCTPCRRRCGPCGVRPGYDGRPDVAAIVKGAAPSKTAATLLPIWPSSGIAPISPADVPPARPGTLSMISASSTKHGVALIKATIAASSLAISTAICFSRRSCIFCTTPGVECSLLVQARLHVDQSLARTHDLGQLLTYRIVGLAPCLDEGFGEPGNRSWRAVRPIWRSCALAWDPPPRLR